MINYAVKVFNWLQPLVLLRSKENFFGPGPAVNQTEDPMPALQNSTHKFKSKHTRLAFCFVGVFLTNISRDMQLIS